VTIASRTLLVLAFGSLVSACGGTDEGRTTEKLAQEPVFDPGSAPVLCEAYGQGPLEFKTLEDFELGAATGGWYTNNDICQKCDKLVAEAAPSDDIAECESRCSSSQIPSPRQKPLAADVIVTQLNQQTEAVSAPRCGSHYALHVRNNVPLLDWGIVIGDQFRPGLDACDWDGIAFWGRKGPSSPAAVRIQLSDRSTDENYVTAEGTPPCNPDASRDETLQGCDKFGSYAMLSQNWQLYLLDFSEMRQAGWGKHVDQLDVCNDCEPLGTEVEEKTARRDQLLDSKDALTEAEEKELSALDDQLPELQKELDRCKAGGLDGIFSVNVALGGGLWDVWIDDLMLFRRGSE